MSGSAKKLLHAAAGSASGDPVYVEDVFSTHLYTGTGSGITINNGIDLDGEGGLVIYRRRDGAENWSFQDTERGVDSVLYSDSTGAAADPGGYGLASFNSNGFTTELNTSSAEYGSWTFRKQKGFFDIQTATLDGSGNAQFTHDLGAAPGMVIVKPRNFSDNWYVYHKSRGTGKYLDLNNNSAESTYTAWGNISATTFDANIGWGSPSGKTVVAYFFADGNDSNAQIFGEDGDESIIKVGSFTTDSSGAAEVGPDLGWEPQWVLLKNATSSGSGSWWLMDSAREIKVDGSGTDYLQVNSSSAGGTFGGYTFNLKHNGFKIPSNAFANGQTFIYVAIRRGPMKEATAGTDLLDFEHYTGDGNSTKTFSLNFSRDFLYQTNLGAATYSYPAFHFRTGKASGPSTAGQPSSSLRFDRHNAVHMTGFENTMNQSGETYLMYAFKRYPKAIDITHWESFDETSLSSFNHPHNLGVKPEVMIWKPYWKVAGSNTPNTNYRIWWDLDADNTYADFTSLNNTNNSWLSDPTATHIPLSTNNNHSYYDVPGPNIWGFQAILMASVEGIIKIGEYDHVSSGGYNTITVTTGFQPRLIFMQVDDNGTWNAHDSARGMGSGNDPYLYVASTNAHTTDQNNIHSITSTGFVINSEQGGAQAEFNYVGSGRKTRYIAIA